MASELAKHWGARLCFPSTLWINQLIRTPYSLLKSFQLKYIYNTSISAVRSMNTKQQTHRQQQSNNIRTELILSLKKKKNIYFWMCAVNFGGSTYSLRKHEQEAHHASNNYATAYYTKSSSLLDIILHVSVRLVQCQLHGSESSSTEGAKTVSRLLLVCRHSNCSLSLNTSKAAHCL